MREGVTRPRILWWAGLATLLVTVIGVGIFFMTAGSQAGESVIRPGAPGGSTATARPQLPLISEADVEFVSGMIPHHEQAIVMIDLLEARAPGDVTLAMAQRMRDSQTGELELMRAWQAGHSELFHGATHVHALGAATQAELDELASLSGVDAEISFLTLMIQHHRGALEMATTRLRVAGDGLITDYARNTFVEQSVEISRMQERLNELATGRSG